MTFNYNDVLKPKSFKRQKEQEFNTRKIIEKYKKGEFRIVTEQARYPLASIKEIFNEYVLSPEYQRRRVWDNKRKSKLIESFIINVPIPPIFLYEYEYSQYEIMDGLQRITTILDFFDNKFKLEDLDIWSELNNCYFSDLPVEIRLSIERRYVSAIILLKETAASEDQAKMMKRLVFERLNTGGVELSAQEIRNALYTSEFNERLIKMAESLEFRYLWGEMDKDKYSRMEDCELVLRFFAYKSACHHNIAKSSLNILDTYSLKARNFSSSEIEILENLFYGTLKIVRMLFNKTAFKSEVHSKKSERMIYDAVMLSCAEVYKKWSPSKIESIDPISISEEKFKCIESNKNIFNGKYTSIKNVKERVALIHEILEEALNAL
ncbi:hypothetical protein COC52_24885 [Priestia megaterium]|uniref:DUF262 domain-containing protein n=1 Tax=Priestia megaterium TaxID=1404 RepID=UPI000BFCA7D7|nr:DUF262 domain-containing protein [Priestia megaterium]PGR23032.1 hypothetical protein COC52_24885 [Priestia megaterium]